MKIRSGILFAMCLLSSLLLTGQENNLEGLFKVDYDTPLTLDLAAEKEEDELGIEPVKQKQKKKKRKVFFGIKTRKGYAKKGFGNTVIVELFHTLKEYEAPPEYARDFYWYHAKKKKIVNSLKVDKKYASVLHGPYRKMKGDQILEAGWFYKGMKHRRWVRYNTHDILQDKKYWWKGWPQESRLAYHDFKKTKLKEVIPVHYGEVNGEYWAFHDNGSLAVRGKYKFGHKVGLWKEYYRHRRVKREVRYPDDPFDFDTNPRITKEWNKKGKAIFDRKKMASK